LCILRDRPWQSGCSIILAIPKSIAKTLLVEAGSVDDLAVEGRKLSVVPPSNQRFEGPSQNRTIAQSRAEHFNL
jgi:hypothetical protein